MKKCLFSMASAVMLFLGVTSCSTPYYIMYDAKMPAEWNKPAEVSSLGVVNHTPDSLSNVGGEINQSLADRLSEETYVQEVIVLDSVLHESMTSNHVNRLIHYLDVDCIASLDSLKLVMTGKNKEDKVAYITLGDFFDALLEQEPSVYAYGNIQAVLNMYLPNQSTPCASIEVEDKIEWESVGDSERDATNYLPSMGEKVGVLIDRIVDRFKDKIAPFWQTVERQVYVDQHKSLAEAKKYIDQEKWDKAAAIWHDMYKNEYVYRIKALAANNLFVYYEKISNPDEAIEWCKKGAANFKRCGATSNAGDLLKKIPELAKRKDELKRLDQQPAAE